MAAQTRYKFTQSVTLGTGNNAWQYEFILSRVSSPYPKGTVPETVASTTTIPAGVKITCGPHKEAFDLAKLTDGDKVENVNVTAYDDESNWLQTNVFTTFNATTEYQWQLRCDKGTGTLGTVFVGVIDPRSITFESEHQGVSGLLTPSMRVYKKVKVTFTAVDALQSMLGRVPLGYTDPFYIGTGDEPVVGDSDYYWWSPSSFNGYLPKTTALPTDGILKLISGNIKNNPTVTTSNISGGWNLTPIMVSGTNQFYPWDGVVGACATFIANRCGFTTGAVDATDAFSHVSFSYGGSLTAAGTTVTSPSQQIALQRQAFFATRVYSRQDPRGPVQIPEYSLVKDGSAWDSLEKLFAPFLQYARLSYNDNTSTVTMTVSTPLSSALSSFLTTEPKVGKLKYTPIGFAARSVSAKIIHPEKYVTESETDEGTETKGLATNNLSFSSEYSNASADVNVSLFTGSWWAGAVTTESTVGPWLQNQFAVFHNGPDYTNVTIVDNNSNGEMMSGGTFLYPFTMNAGFKGSLGTVTGKTLTEVVARAIYSLFCGQSLTDFRGTATPANPIEVVEFELPIDKAVVAVDGTYVDTSDIDNALLKTIPITTDAQHTFIIIGVECDWVNLKRVAKVTAIRTVA